MTNEDKLKALDIANAEIIKKYGKESNIVRSRDDMSLDIPGWTLSSPLLMNIIGGKFPKGRIIEIYGPESAGKTSLALKVAADIQKQGGIIAYVDAEFSFDSGYAETLGIDTSPSKFRIIQGDYGEQNLDVVDTYVNHNIFDLIIVDSVAALVPKAELEGDYGASHMGLQARMMSQAMRKLTGKLSHSETTIIFINQIRCLDCNTIIIKNKQLDIIDNINIGDIINNKTVIGKYEQENILGKVLFSKYRPEFNISYNHKQPVISEKGYVLKKGEDIKIKDWLIQPIQDEEILSDDLEYIDLKNLIEDILPDNENSKFICLPKKLNEDLAFLMGVYYSDGSFREYLEKSDYGIQFTENNKERFDLIKENLLNLNLVFSFNYPHIYIGGKIILDFFKKLGLKRYAKNKIIPDLILKSKLSVIKSFIRGAFFDTHGFDKKGFIFTNENDDSIIQFSNILYYMGIFSDIRKGKELNKTNYLYITGNDAIKFNKLIGFAEKTKSIKANEFKTSLNARGKNDVIPYYLGINILKELKNKKKNLTNFYKYQNINICKFKKINFCRKTFIEFLKYTEDNKYINFISNNRFTEIIDIKNKTIKKAIDIEVNENELFCAGQFLTHNSKIGVMFGSPETTTGGRALKFYASIRWDVRKIESIGKEDDVTGIKMKVTTKKNKVGPPFRKAEIELNFENGFNTTKEYVDLAVTHQVIAKAGAWYSYNDEKIGQGKDNVCKYLNEHIEIFEEIKKKTDQLAFPKKIEKIGVKERPENKFKDLKKELGLEKETIKKDKKKE